MSQDRERWDRVKELFHRALEREPAEREQFLAEVCDQDTTLRVELESLLASHNASDGFLRGSPEAEAAEVIAADEGRSLVGEHLGSYRVIRRVGRGGTGAVYLAVRDDDEFQKRVAIKVIRRGMATAEMLHRFRAERQILASIDHPHIARLLDGGSTDDGLPYFVMEYIEGEPITRFCDANRLGIGARLELFRIVCQAVQTAHQNLVVHRDLKPGNILVTAEGVPKLLDFGIAKLLNPEMSAESHEPTLLELRVMTPEFASPEQIQGRAITTTSDVYALGVLLYELLTGHRPHRLADMSLHEMEVVVCTQEPARPSDAIARVDEARESGGRVREITPESVARARGISLERLRRGLLGDLDNIVLKALRKEPARRYASVEQLEGDVQRHQEGLPVLARPDTFSYRTSKFVRRHRLPVAVAVTVLLFSAAFAVNSAIHSRRLGHERDRAAQAAAEAQAVNEFLQGMLAAADPLEGLGRDTTVVESLDAAVATIGQTFSVQPAVEAAVRHTVGRTYLNLGRLDDAEEQLRVSLQLRRRLFSDDDLAIAESLNSLGETRYERGDFDGAERLYREAYLMRQSLLGARHPDVATSLDNLGNVFHDRGDLETAERMYRDALEIRREALGPEHRDVASSLNNVAVVLHDQGDIETAEALYRESLALTRRVLGNEHPDVSIGLNNLAALLHDQGDLDGAEPLYRESVAMARKLLGPQHSGTAVNLHNLGVLLHDRGKLDEAEAAYREALTMTVEHLGPDHATVADLLESLAEVEEERGNYAAAEQLYGEALEVHRRIYEADHPAIAVAGYYLGNTRMKQGRYAAAENLMIEGWRAARDDLGSDDELVQEWLGGLVELYEGWGRPDEAARYRALLDAPGGVKEQ